MIPRAARTAAVLLLAAGLTACSPSVPGEPAAGEPPTIEVTDAWVKAATVDDRMTGAFGVITNPGEEDVRVVGITSPVAGRAELHETVAGDGADMVMQEMADGFVVTAGSQHELEPGADHLMMELTEDVRAGDDVEITLELEGGATVTFTASGRTFAGANEEYGSHGEDATGADDATGD